MFEFLFSPQLGFASEPVSVFPGSGSNDADSTARRVGPEWGVLVSNKWMFQATKISPRRRSLPSAPKFITDLVLFWCQSVVPGSFLVGGGGIYERARPTACLVGFHWTIRAAYREGWRRDDAGPKLLIRVWSEAGSGSRDRKRADGSPANWLECRWCDSLCLRAALHPLVTRPLPASNMTWRHIILFSGRPCRLQSTAERWRALIKQSFLLQQHASTLFITNLFSYSVQTVHVNNFCTILALKNALILPKIYKTLQLWWKILKNTASASLDVPVCAASAAFVVRVSAKQAFSSTSGMCYYCQHKTVNWLCDPSRNSERQIAFNLNWQSSEEQDGFIHCCP